MPACKDGRLILRNLFTHIQYKASLTPGLQQVVAFKHVASFQRRLDHNPDFDDLAQHDNLAQEILSSEYACPAQFDNTSHRSTPGTTGNPTKKASHGHDLHIMLAHTHM